MRRDHYVGETVFGADKVLIQKMNKDEVNFNQDCFGEVFSGIVRST